MTLRRLHDARSWIVFVDTTIAEVLRLTEWEDCLEILTEVVPIAATAALHELDILGWHPVQANAPSHT